MTLQTDKDWVASADPKRPQGSPCSIPKQLIGFGFPSEGSDNPEMLGSALARLHHTG